MPITSLFAPLLLLLLTCIAPIQAIADQSSPSLAIVYSNDVQGETAPCG